MPVAVIFQVILLAGLAILLQAGSGPLKNDLPIYPWGYIALINTDEYTKHINDQTYRGLPDSHDFSKQKDFFAIFPALYCSGWKKDGNYHADYCSPWGRQLFDLHRLWRVWGVDLMENKLVAQTPRMIFIGLITSAASAALALLVGFLAVYSYRCTLLVAVLSWVTMIATLSTAGLSHTFVTKLVSYAPKLNYDGTGRITINPGKAHIIAIWAGVTLTITIAALRTLIAHRHRKVHNAANRPSASRRAADAGPAAAREKIPFIGILRRATGDLNFLNRGGRGERWGRSSYKHISVSGEEMTGLGGSRNGSQIDLVSRSRERSLASSRGNSQAGSRDLSRAGSRDPSPGEVQVLYDRGRNPQGSTAYEPLRHQQVPG
ncbi:hypothetical protein K469DRAFT_798617 [Zopfia rhizophila CBS 207.26]|uniref:Integral membrane protein n=1 Tax=Zopfia rhizophila CBS 207.26 TaxID=1314779 RepID=A0A6A6DKU3_9PEZI|nr:hypothetical protein K469DRAFT_798617 [Zopfia rhizophila CBS 207.26]